MALDSLAPPQAPLAPQPPEPEPAQPPLTGGEVIDFISTLMRLLVPKPVIVTSGRKGFTGILSRADAKIPTSGRQPVGEKSSAGHTQSRTSTSSGRESGNFVGVNSSLKPVTLSPPSKPHCPCLWLGNTPEEKQENTLCSVTHGSKC